MGEVPPRSAVFLAAPPSSCAAGRPPRADSSDLWLCHGFHYRIPPLYDTPHASAADGGGFPSYAAWGKSLRPQLGAQPASLRALTPASRGSLASLRRPPPSLPMGEESLNETEREDLERWKRCYSSVVKRDVPRQQKAFSAASREGLGAAVTSSPSESSRVPLRLLLSF